LICSVCTYTNLHNQKKNLIRVLYIIIFLIIPFSFSDLFIRGVVPKFIFPYWPNPGILYTFYLIFIYIGLTVYTMVILLRYYKKDSEKYKSIQYIILGSILGFGGGITNFFLWYDIPVFPYGNILVSFYPLMLVIASSKYHLFNIKIIATELLVFLIWATILFEFLIEESLKGQMVAGGLFVFMMVAGIWLIKSVIKEVRQREKIEKLAGELKAANEKLIELDKTKAGMYSFVSHQIKAPIGIIKGFAQLIYDGSYGAIPEKVKERVEDIKKSCDRLIKLVEDFLNLRKIEEGKMDYQFEEINIVDLAKSVFEELKLLAEQKKLEFTMECAEEKITVKADEQRLRQVILNLIENSIKYTPSGFVKVELGMENDSVLFSVSDSGIGIKKEVLSELFDQFKRAKEARAIQGTGLGLFVAREIVKAHNGEIWAESEGEGKGSGFYVKLKS